MWFPRTAYRRGVPPFWDKRQNRLWYLVDVTVKRQTYCVPSHKCWCPLRVSGETPQCPHNLQSWPASGRSLAPSQLPSGLRPEKEETEFQSNDVRVMSECSQFISNLVYEEIYSAFFSVCRCPHQGREATFVPFVEQWSVCNNNAVKGGRRSAQDLTSEVPASSPLLRCAATSEISPWAANWCMDRAYGSIHCIISGAQCGPVLYHQGLDYGLTVY